MTDPSDHLRSLRALDPSKKTPTTLIEAPKQKSNQKMEQLLDLAKEMGFFVTPKARWITLLAGQISTRLRAREGSHVYQSAAFSIPNFPYELASQTFEHLQEIQDTPKGTTTWRAPTMQQTTELLACIFAVLGATCAGASKAISRPSESVHRVLATMMPNAEFSHVVKRQGTEMLYVNFIYSLSDEARRCCAAATGFLRCPTRGGRSGCWPAAPASPPR